jgi:hypothetical protein
MSNIDVTVTPFSRAFRFDFWMVGPSAMGSVKGRPSSIISIQFYQNQFKAVDQITHLLLRPACPA